MSLKASILSVASAVLLAGMAPVAAHHAVSAEFDSTKPVALKGTIKKIEWTNPHIYTNVEVKEPDGTVVVYRVEGAAPNTLFRQGWRKDDLKIGEPVTVNGIRAKAAGSLNIGQATITTADGRKIYGQGAGGGARGPAQQ
jgi:hypothetical protein